MNKIILMSELNRLTGLTIDYHKSVINGVENEILKYEILILKQNICNEWEKQK